MSINTGLWRPNCMLYRSKVYLFMGLAILFATLFYKRSVQEVIARMTFTDYHYYMRFIFVFKENVIKQITAFFLDFQKDNSFC